MRRAHNALDLVGQRFGRLTVTAKHPKKIYNQCVGWECRCDCGADVLSTTGNLRSGNTSSCGCWDREFAGIRLRERATTHGLSKHPLFKTWNGMIARCYNPRSKTFRLYGARGIKVCDRWRKSVEAFIEDMGPRPSPEHTLDRKNNMGDYEPDNCRWATDSEQNNNRRNSVRITAFGRTLSMADWSRETGIDRDLIWQRIMRDRMPIEDALMKRCHQ